MLLARNFGEQAHTLRIDFDFDADFADLFEVRGYQRRSRGNVTASVRWPDVAHFVYASQDGVPRATEIHFDPLPKELSPRHAAIELELPPKQRRSVTMSVHCLVGEQKPERRVLHAMRSATRELRAATRRAASVETSSSLANEVLCRSMADVAMLVTDTEHGPYPYAGVPWFSTAFGRDGIITAMQLLWLYPGLARGVLRYLAACQAQTEDPAKDAEPGKILHETRKCELAILGEVPFAHYYGSIDSTPLFVALAGLYWQYTADNATLDAIWPNVKAALAWIDHYGDADGDGFVEYRRRLDTGLANQGWKDSGDAVFHADGRLANAPIALCEVQGYVYLARTLAARMAEARGETLLAARLTEQARSLREQFEAKFWDDELGMYVLALDGDKNPCRVRTSNAGQVLFTGIASADRAAIMAQTLTSTEFLTGWGIRTVSEREQRFNPTSYHNGSIWPHDNALIALGLSRYGHSDLATRANGHHVRRGSAHGSAATARALLRHAPAARQGPHSLSSRLLAAGMGGGRTLCDAAGLLGAGSRCHAAGGALSVSAVARITAHAACPRHADRRCTRGPAAAPPWQRRLRQHPQSRGRCGDRHAAEVIS